MLGSRGSLLAAPMVTTAEEDDETEASEDADASGYAEADACFGAS